MNGDLYELIERVNALEALVKTLLDRIATPTAPPSA